MPDNLETNLALAKLREFAPGAVEDAREFRGEITLWIRPEHLRHVAEFLRDEPGLKFTFLSDITALDHFPEEPRFETVYHLLSIEANQRLCLKARLVGDDPTVDSMVRVWPGANAFEREVFDLFGIKFAGHPDLRRIILPEDWEGHPLRKDYPTEGYR